MNVSTKTYRWLPWAVAIAISLLILLLVPSPREVRPWFQAYSVSVGEEIAAFYGAAEEPMIHWPEMAAALAGILLFFVIGPSLWVFAESRNDPVAESGSDRELKKGVDWFTGVVIVSFAFLLMGPDVAIRYQQMENFREGAERNQNQEQLRAGLVTMSYRAAELYYLPQELGGGSGSFNTIVAMGEENPRPVELNDLMVEIVDTSNRYILGPINSDSLITIYAVGYTAGKDPDFENANGDRGRVQRSVQVNPESEYHDWIVIRKIFYDN